LVQAPAFFSLFFWAAWVICFLCDEVKFVACSFRSRSPFFFFWWLEIFSSLLAVSIKALSPDYHPWYTLWRGGTCLRGTCGSGFRVFFRSPRGLGCIGPNVLPFEENPCDDFFFFFFFFCFFCAGCFRSFSAGESPTSVLVLFNGLLKPAAITWRKSGGHVTTSLGSVFVFSVAVCCAILLER